MTTNEDTIERIRAATYDHPMSHSHSEWSARLSAILDDHVRTSIEDLETEVQSQENTINLVACLLLRGTNAEGEAMPDPEASARAVLAFNRGVSPRAPRPPEET